MAKVQLRLRRLMRHVVIAILIGWMVRKVPLPSHINTGMLIT